MQKFIMRNLGIFCLIVALFTILINFKLYLRYLRRNSLHKDQSVDSCPPITRSKPIIRLRPIYGYILITNNDTNLPYRYKKSRVLKAAGINSPMKEIAVKLQKSAKN